MRQDRSTKHKIINGIVIAVILIALFALTMFLIERHGLTDEQFGDTGEWGANEGADQFYLYIDGANYVSSDDVDTYLLIGTDNEREGEAGFNGGMADFLMLVLIDNTTQKYGMYQLDRNTMTLVDILNENGESMGAETQQLCISHWYGQNDEQRNENTVRAVSNLFGELPIDGYYTLNMEDIGRVNNALGRVEVTVETDMTSVDPAFVAGSTVVLSDDQAEKFVRARMGVGSGTNKERMSRQRQYLQKVYSMLMSQIKENPEYINDLYDQLHDLVESNMHDKKFSQITNQLVNYDSEGIITFEGTSEKGVQEVSGDVLEEFYVNGQSIVDNLKRVMQLEPYVEEPQQ